MSTYDTLAALPLVVEAYELAGLDQDVSRNFLRRTTVVTLHGVGETGVGEDVTYDGDEQLRQQSAGPVLALAGTHTLDSFSERLGSLDLFPGASAEVAHRFVPYRRWAFESAALDLALRQAGTTLGDALGREARPVRFVVSTRLPEPPSTERLLALRVEHPGTRFKLDPTSDWDHVLVEELAALGAVDAVDLKGAYKGTIVDQPADPALYRLVASGLPSAWIEDPDLSSPETDEALQPYRDRISWDAVIHSVDDIERLPFRPGAINVKPSRFGSVSGLLAAYDHCAAQGIPMYGGGQFELGPGRGQIQYLASLFHPEAPNDVAPAGYNDPVPASGLASSPLPPTPAETGFRWGRDGLPNFPPGHTV